MAWAALVLFPGHGLTVAGVASVLTMRAVCQKVRDIRYDGVVSIYRTLLLGHIRKAVGCDVLQPKSMTSATNTCTCSWCTSPSSRFRILGLHRIQHRELEIQPSPFPPLPLRLVYLIRLIHRRKRLSRRFCCSMITVSGVECRVTEIDSTAPPASYLSSPVLRQPYPVVKPVSNTLRRKRQWSKLC